MFIANKHHLSCEYHGLVIKYIKSHHPNWCIKVITHPKAALLVVHIFFCNQAWLGQLVMFSLKLLLEKKLYSPFLWMGFNCLKVTFYHMVSRTSWYSKDERLSWPWSHPAVLNLGPLDWKCSTSTLRPLLV